MLALALVTVIGFATHGETGLSFLPRMLAAFFPLVVGWFGLAPWFGLFAAETPSDPKQFWRPALVMVFAAPLATVLRAALLGVNAIPVFTLVLGSTSALGMVTWRWLYRLWLAKSR
jgi:hypothetical protein